MDGHWQGRRLRADGDGSREETMEEKKSRKIEEEKGDREVRDEGSDSKRWEGEEGKMLMKIRVAGEREKKETGR